LPAISPSQIDSVVFLYTTVDAAKQHARSGGTAFLIGLPVHGTSEERWIVFAVSCRHVVWETACPVMRVNRRDGGEPDVFDLDQNDWIPHPTDDLAIIPVAGAVSVSGVELSSVIHKISYVPCDNFVDEAFLRNHDVSPGEDAYMIGRFLNWQGKEEGQPALRFGNLSMMAQPLWNGVLKREQEGFAVEMRSRTGFSGSPVFIYGTAFNQLKERFGGRHIFFGLLGVNWGYIYERDIDGNGTTENTWLNGVVPTWKIRELLEMPKIKSVIAESEATARRLFPPKDDPATVAAEGSERPATPIEGHDQHKG